MAITVQELRQRIDAKHARALEALAEITSYLNEGESLPATANGTFQKVRKHQRKAPAGSSNRDKVLASIANDWATAERIAQETGLEIKQVRGVLYAPKLPVEIEKRTEGEVMEYRVKPS